MAPNRYYSSTASKTTLTGSVTNVATSIVVTATTGFPVSTPYTLILERDTANEEVVTVTAVAGTTLTVTRGVDGTTGLSHTAGATVEHGVSARDFSEPQAHIGTVGAVHGLVGNIVGTTDAQTLSSKTLTTPTIASFTNANHTHAAGAGGGLLAQAQTHQSPDTDAATGSLHHTLGVATLQAAAGDHDHSSVKLAQANTHQTPDTDTGLTSLHHTLGTGANQAAAGDHSHTDLTDSGWSSYTPTLTGISLGNGTIAGRYKQIGKTVRFTVKITLGSTSTVAAATVSLPVTASASAVEAYGGGHLLDFSAVAHYPAMFTIAPSATATSTIYGQGSTFWPGFTSSQPFTWATSDTITISGFYEV